MRHRAVFTTAALVLAALASAQDRPRVAILPVINHSGEKWEALKASQTEKSETYLYDQFTKRGFRTVLPSDVRAAIREKELDFEDEENHRRAVLYDLGRKLEVDFIVFGVITKTDFAEKDRTFYKDVEGYTDVKVWLLDVKNERIILSAKPFTGRSGGARLTKGSDRQIQAAENAFRDALKEFFRVYPERG